MTPFKILTNLDKTNIPKLLYNSFSKLWVLINTQWISSHFRRYHFANSSIISVLGVNKKISAQINTFSLTDKIRNNAEPQGAINKLFQQMMKKNDNRYEEYVSQCFDKDFNIHDGWQNIFDKIDKEHKISKNVFGTFLMKRCLQEHNLSCAKAYVEFLKTREEEINFVAMSTFLEILAQNSEPRDIKLFTSFYEKLVKKEPLLDEIRLSVINSLLCIGYYEEAMHHLNLMEKNGNLFFIVKSLNLCIQFFAKDNDIEGAFKHLELLEKKYTLDLELSFNPFLYPETITSLLQAVQRSHSKELAEKHIATIFRAMQTTEVKVDQTLAQNIVSILSKSWKINQVKIPNRKSCISCHTKLMPPTFDSATFSKLRVEVLEKIVKGQDIFHSTTPTEWQQFITFLNQKAPFDLVLDGLNLYYLHRELNMSEQNFVQLSQDYYKSKILVLSRSHLIKWTKPREKLFPNMTFFFVDSMSKDDVFILYAAFHSGINCKIATSDYLRNHKFVLENPALKRQFLIWQMINQILLLKPTPYARLKYKKPYQYLPIAQCNEVTQCWHFPIKHEEKVDYFLGNDSWLCVRKKRRC